VGPEEEHDGSKCMSSDKITEQFMIMCVCESKVIFQHSVLR
jgi:hypothetical protein